MVRSRWVSGGACGKKLFFFAYVDDLAEHVDFETATEEVVELEVGALPLG